MEYDVLIFKPFILRVPLLLIAAPLVVEYAFSMVNPLNVMVPSVLKACFFSQSIIVFLVFSPRIVTLLLMDISDCL